MTEKFTAPDAMMSDNIIDWGQYAKCKGEPASWWFVESYGNAEGRWNTVRAKEICSQCSVRVQCLNYANENLEIYGVWGGLTPKERGVGRLARIARRKYS